MESKPRKDTNVFVVRVRQIHSQAFRRSRGLQPCRLPRKKQKLPQSGSYSDVPRVGKRYGQISVQVRGQLKMGLRRGLPVILFAAFLAVVQWPQMENCNVIRTHMGQQPNTLSPGPNKRWQPILDTRWLRYKRLLC